MEVQRDFNELLGLLNKNGVEYLIVGGYALAFHGAPRYTGDLDIFVGTSPENVRRIMSALTEFGFGEVGLAETDFLREERVVQLGVAPVRIDLITSIHGVPWESAWSGKERGTYGEVPVWYIGRREFIENKRAIGRKKDLADIEALGEE